MCKLKKPIDKMEHQSFASFVYSFSREALQRSINALSFRALRMVDNTAAIRLSDVSARSRVLQCWVVISRAFRGPELLGVFGSWLCARPSRDQQLVDT
jgi:hypothetical protein